VSALAGVNSCRSLGREMFEKKGMISGNYLGWKKGGGEKGGKRGGSCKRKWEFWYPLHAVRENLKARERKDRAAVIPWGPGGKIEEKGGER